MHNHTHEGREGPVREGRGRCGERGFGGRHFGGRFGGERFGGGRGFGRGGGEEELRGRGRRRRFDNDALRLVLLKLIESEPRHGYELIRAIDELTGGQYAPSPGVVYPTLSLLDEMGLIAAVDSDGARKRFEITADGTAHLAEKAPEVEEAMARLASLAGRIDPAPVKRSLANLSAVLQGRLREDGVDKARLLDIAALIDEAAQKIERL